MSQALERSDRSKSLIWRDVVKIFRILILHFKLIFILIAAVVIEFTFVAFQLPGRFLLVYSCKNHESRGFCYPVATSTMPVDKSIFRSIVGFLARKGIHGRLLCVDINSIKLRNRCFHERVLKQLTPKFCKMSRNSSASMQGDKHFLKTNIENCKCCYFFPIIGK